MGCFPQITRGLGTAAKAGVLEQDGYQTSLCRNTETISTFTWVSLDLQMENPYTGRRGGENYGDGGVFVIFRSVLYILLTTPLRVWENLTFKYLSMVYGLSVVWP